MVDHVSDVADHVSDVVDHVSDEVDHVSDVVNHGFDHGWNKYYEIVFAASLLSIHH